MKLLSVLIQTYTFLGAAYIALCGSFTVPQPCAECNTSRSFTYLHNKPWSPLSWVSGRVHLLQEYWHILPVVTCLAALGHSAVCSASQQTPGCFRNMQN